MACMLACVNNHRCCGGVISRQCAPAALEYSEPKSPVVITMIPLWIHEERDCVAGGWQVLDNVEQHDNVGCAEPPKKGLVDLTGEHVQARSSAVFGGVLGKLDP